MKFVKYHALGNDYLVVSPDQFPGPLDPEQIQRICHRNYGIGSDGILYGPLPVSAVEYLRGQAAGSSRPAASPGPETAFGLRIFNPDGSEAEKSGNGLRIFSRFLWDCQRVGNDPFEIVTLGGWVRAQVQSGGHQVRVELGQVSFWSERIPVAGPPRDVLQESVTVGQRTFSFCAATIGNPHCVVWLPQVNEALAREFGPLLERHALFPNRTNVQFLQVLNRNRIRIEIWERGAGYTLASGSSSSAAAAVAHKLNLCDAQIEVEMPGGVIHIEIGPDFSIVMTGPVTKVAEGTAAPEMFQHK